MSTPKFCVYVLRNLQDRSRYYTGVTSDPDARLTVHNAGRSAHTANAFMDECTALGYALHFKDVPHGPDKVATVALLQAEGAPV